MAAARLGMAALADVDGLSAAKDPADTIQGALDRWRDDFNARPATGINVKMGADHFLLQIGIRSAIFGTEANAERAEEFDASAGNPADGHCPVSLRFVKASRHPSPFRQPISDRHRQHLPCPRPLSRRPFRQDTPGTSPTAMAGSLCRTAQRCQPIPMAGSRSPPEPIFHPTEQAESFSRTGRAAFRTMRGATSAPEASLLGGCCLQAGCSTDGPPPACPLNCHPPPRAFVKSVELESSRSRTMDNCLARVRSGIPCPASAASGRSCLPVLSGRSSSFSGVPKAALSMAIDVA